MSNKASSSGDFVPQTPSARGPRWETSVPQTPVLHTSKSWLRHCCARQVTTLFWRVCMSASVLLFIVFTNYFMYLLSH